MSEADGASVTSAKSESPKTPKRVQFAKPTIALEGKPLHENGTNDLEEEDRDILSPLPPTSTLSIISCQFWYKVAGQMAEWLERLPLEL